MLLYCLVDVDSEKEGGGTDSGISSIGEAVIEFQEYKVKKLLCLSHTPSQFKLHVVDTFCLERICINCSSSEVLFSFFFLSFFLHYERELFSFHGSIINGTNPTGIIPKYIFSR